jgi:hypothetical protein
MEGSLPVSFVVCQGQADYERQPADRLAARHGNELHRTSGHRGLRDLGTLAATVPWAAGDR